MHVVERSEKLVAILAAHGPGRPINVDNLLLRESMDVIGAPLHAGSCTSASILLNEYYALQYS